jgi:serine/threonine kinase 32
MVEHKQTRASYALKYINKMRAVRMKAVGNIIQERRLLEKVSVPPPPTSLPKVLICPWQIDHPFVVNLRYAFQDDENCFFVLDLMLGGDLRCTSRPSPRSQTSSCIYPRYLSITCPVHMQRDSESPFREETVRFYAAQLSSALIYLHQHRIIHR